MDFVENSVRSIDISLPKIGLTNFPGVSVILSRYQTKSYPYVSSYQIVNFEKPLPLAPKPTRNISIRSPNEFFRKVTLFVIGDEHQNKGIYTYNVQCFRKEKELTIMIYNPQNYKVTFDRGQIGHTIEDIELKHEPKFSVFDSIAFVNHLMNNDTNWDKIFHVIEKQSSQVISKHECIETTKSNEKLKETEKGKCQQHFINQYELERDFSNDLKDLKLQFENTEENLRPIDLPKDQFKGFSNEDQNFLKMFDFSKTDISNKKLLQLMKTLTKNKDVHSQHKYDVGKIQQKFLVKLIPNSTLAKQRPSKAPLHYQEKLEILNNCVNHQNRYHSENG